MKSLLIHPRTRKQLKLFIESPQHALMFTGPAGSGKFSLAKLAASEILKLKSPAGLANYPYFIHLVRKPKKQDIPIESIRRVIAALDRKTPGTNDIRRVILIENAHELSLPAQNALLKVLEEPPDDTLFILTAIEGAVLPTIASRAYQLAVNSSTKEDAQKYFGQDYPAKTIESAWLLSQGRPGLLSALLADDEDHPLKQAVNQAKSLVGRDAYEALSLIEKASEMSLDLTMAGLTRVLSALHHSSLSKNSSNSRKILRARDKVEYLKQAKAANANERLTALELALHLKS